jgi:hypothetical protein
MADRYDDRDRYIREGRSRSHEEPDSPRREHWRTDDRYGDMRRDDQRREPAWDDERSYGSNRPYGDRDYGYGARGEYREYGWRTRADRDYAWRPEPAAARFTGISHDPYDRPASDSSGYVDFSRQGYGGPYGRERYGAREWSSTEGWRVPGPFSGRGPRGYQRSDQRIEEELHERLTAHGLIDATDVQCRVASGEVTLTGFVNSRQARRAAEDVAEDIYGVRQVSNQLRVRPHPDESGVGRTSVLGLTESQVQTRHMPADASAGPGRSRTRS